MSKRTGAVFGVLVAALLLLPGAGAGGQERPLRTHDPVGAGDDFVIQGEYIGSLERDGAPEMFGVQVVARGRGRFDAWGLRGGLPGAGWNERDREPYQGTAEGRRATLARTGSEGECPAATLAIDDGRIRAIDAGGQVIGRLERVVRKSPTLGRKAPEGAVVLFDGTTAEHFETKNGRRRPPIVDRTLQLTGGSGGFFTARPHGSGSLHLEFRLPFEPEGRGQGRANSGCYLQSRYEVQILDSFGLEAMEDRCGGVYSSGQHPRVNMCFPPLSWQTFDIDFTAAVFDEGNCTSEARLTVRHNGVLVYEDLEIDHRTTAAPEEKGPDPKPLYLQDHGHEVRFRNIWMVER